MLHEFLIILEGAAFAAAAGLVYGLFGGGSGLFLMPGFYFLMKYFPVAQGEAMQVAITTTATTSVLLGVSAVRVQLKRNNVDWALFKRLCAGLLTGTVLAVILLNILPSGLLKHLFGVVVIAVSVWLFIYRPERDEKKWSLSALGNYLMTSLIALVWFLLGVAVFTVPYLIKSGTNIHKAVGCGTLASGVFSAVASVLLIITGMFHVGVSWSHVGFLNLPLLLIAIVPSMIAAYIGAHLSHRLSQDRLKLLYSGLVFVVGVLMTV